MTFKKLSEFQRLLLKWRDKETYRDYKFFLSTQRNPVVHIDHLYKADTHFKHSGNAGDIIYSLPAVFALASKGKAHLHLNVNQPMLFQHKYHPLGNVMLNDKMIEMLLPLFLHQPGIGSCDIYTDQAIDYDLDLFRNYNFHYEKGHIARWYFNVFGVYSDLSQPWLTAPKNDQFSEYIVLSRSHRYQSPGVSYSFLKKYPKKIFMGVPAEFEEMRKEIPDLEHYLPKDFLDAASVIKGARLFIGNQSFLFSLAEAMKSARLLEVCYYCPNVIVEGAGGHDFYYQAQFEYAVKNLIGY